LSIPLVASNDCHYLVKEDVHAHDVLLCVQTGKTVQDTDRLKFRTDQLYLKSKAEMYAAFKDYPGALENSVNIAERCHLEFDFKSYHFPKFDVSPDHTVDEIFEQKVRDGFNSILKSIKKKHPDADEKIYIHRIENEIDVIKTMGFSGYFLIVADFIHYAKKNHIPVGPGRGSAAGSLVAYSLGITDLDPIEHGLIFERFLNPARKSMPDIDVDFCINGREDVFKYVVEKYGGGDYVAQIITFGKLKTRAVIRDVGRALDIPLHEVDAIAKMVPDVLNIRLDDALDREPRLKELARQKPEVDDLIRICRVLEGLPRHASTHAAGVVIADKPLVEYMPLYKGKKGEVVTQFDMKCVEKIGLVKFDFLGLRNLTVIENTLSLIAAQGVAAPDLSNLDFKDAATYRLLASGETTGVFQLESSGMKDLMVRLRPESFDEIIALVALYRPGPLESGMVDDFVDRKHGKKALEYIVPQLEPILKETFGVIVYQEQVMKIASDLANYSMAEADDLRKAMGKKIPKIMAMHRERFMQGAAKNNIPSEKAGKIFGLMEKFGGYGFNKSHSAAYALIAYQTAYLKAHFPVEFMASLLTSEMHSTDGVVKYIGECRSHGIEVLPPDINESDKVFAVSGSKIRFGLAAVKNVGEGAIESIIEARSNGNFSSLFEFCEQVDLKKVNKRVIESLVKCGAFDATGNYRSQMLAALEDCIDYGQRVQKERTDPQMGLFNLTEAQKSVNLPSMPEMKEWEEKELLALEKESLGFYITGHPLNRYEDLLGKFTNTNSVALRERNDGETVTLGGMVRNIKTIKTKKGDLMAFVTLEDLQGAVEITIFSSLYANVYDLLTNDNTVLVRGLLQKDENSVKLLADSVIAIDKAEETWTTSIHFNLDITRTEKTLLEELNAVIKRHPGSCPAFIHLRSPEKTETIIALPNNIKVKAGASLIKEVNRLVGYPAAETVCRPIESPANGNGYNGYHNGYSKRQRRKR
jgi:DNA polymerase-3 subunit alpha